MSRLLELSRARVYFASPTIAIAKIRDYSQSTGERSPNLVLGVLCHTARKKIEIFSVMGCRRRQFSPPKDFCRGLHSAGNWYGLWPRFHDAQVPNGQCGVTHNTQVQAKYMDSG